MCSDAGYAYDLTGKYNVKFATGFSADPHIFGCLKSYNGGDPVAVELMNASKSEATFQLKEDICKDQDKFHLKEELWVVAIEDQSHSSRVPIKARDHAEQQPVYCAETGNFYQYVDFGEWLDWEWANLAVANRPRGTLGTGKIRSYHLATATSNSEKHCLAMSGKLAGWIGATNSKYIARYDERFDNPQAVLNWSMTTGGKNKQAARPSPFLY